MSAPLSFRRAREDDLDRLVEIHSSAFPDPRRYDARVLNFKENRFGAFDDLVIAERGAAIVAHAFLFSFDIGFGGALVKSCGIASVGVAPEARGSGVAAQLLDRLHDEARARGDAISVLFAFRQGFYARHGYASASTTRRLVFSPHAIPRAWRADGVRAARGDDRVAITDIHRCALLKRTGWNARNERQWEELFTDEAFHWFVATRGGESIGYVAWSLVQSESHAQATMVVRELVARDDDAERALFALVGAQRDQIDHVTMNVSEDDPIDRVLVDADRMRFGTDDAEHVVGEILGGPMIHILDPSRAIAARGYAADGDVEFVVDDAASYVLRAKDGVGRVEAMTGAPRLHMTSTTLAGVLFGALKPSHAARLGLVRADDASAIAHADRVLALAPYFALDPF